MSGISTDISPLQKSIRADLDSMSFGDFGTDGLYRGGGAGDGVPVRVFVPQVKQGRQAGLGQSLGMSPGSFGATHPQGRGASMRLEVKASLPGETANGAGVFPSGGILRPKVGDTFEVAGFVAGLPEQTTVKLGVVSIEGKEDVQLVAGVKWNVGVKP